VIIFPAVIMVIALLIYVSISPFFKKQDRSVSIVPHGGALEIGELESIVYNHVGITVDFSVKDRNTIRHALIQGGKNARYLLIHVVETAAARFHGDKVLDRETQSDTDNLMKYQQNLKAMGYVAEIAIGYGTASQAIAGIVKNNQIELLVMGAHGHKGISDLIFGTTVETVRHKIDIPVLIIK
jgi:manganese transport protein